MFKYTILTAFFISLNTMAAGVITDGVPQGGSGNFLKGYVKNSICQKNGLNITTSEATVARDVDAADKLSDISSCLITTSANNVSHTIAFDTKTLDLDTMAENNCEVVAYYKGNGATDGWTFSIDNGSGTDLTTPVALVDSTTFNKIGPINYPCTQSIKPKFVSTGENKTLNVGVQYRENTNVGSVASAEFVGSVLYSGTASCVWQATSTSWGDFPVDNDCTAAAALTQGSQTVSLPATAIPAIRVANAKAGTYKVLIEGNVGPTGYSQDCYVSVSDTAGYGSNGVERTRATTSPAFFEATSRFGEFTYTSAGDRTFRLAVKAGAASTCQFPSPESNSLPAKISVYRYPTSSETAVRVDQSAWYVDAIMDGANANLSGSALTSYTEVSDAGLTLKPQSGSAPVGVMCSATNPATAPSTSNTTCAAGNESVGINFSIPKAGAYEVCVYSAVYNPGTTNTGFAQTFQLIETPTNAQTLTLEGGTRQTVGFVGSGGSLGNYPVSNCSIFNWASAGIKGVRLMYEQEIYGSPPSPPIFIMGASATLGQNNARFTVKPITANYPAPLLVGSVTSKSSGLSGISYATASTTCTTGTCALTANTPDISVTFNSTGNYTITTSSAYNGVMGCAVTPYQGTSAPVYIQDGNFTPTSTQFKFQCNRKDTHVADNCAFSFICFGNR
jgi:hypothetical protein